MLVRIQQSMLTTTVVRKQVEAMVNDVIVLRFWFNGYSGAHAGHQATLKHSCIRARPNSAQPVLSPAENP